MWAPGRLDPSIAGYLVNLAIHDGPHAVISLVVSVLEGPITPPAGGKAQSTVLGISREGRWVVAPPPRTASAVPQEGLRVFISSACVVRAEVPS